MWHEARKQERKIRGMLVDYRKRAERRQDFYEKIKSDPTQFMQVHGRRCKIHLDPAIAAAGESPAIMMPWQGQQDNLIDRFDVRAHLDFIPAVIKSDTVEEISQEERQCNYERYRILAQNDFLAITEERYLHQLHLEEQFGINAHQMENEKTKKKTGGVAIGYVYEENAAPESFASNPTNAPNTAGNESGEESDSDIDMDVSIDISKIDTNQAHELNSYGRQYGMTSNDFYSFLTKDADEAESLRMAREEEQEKIMLCGRKSRRERRAQREKRFAGRAISPPSYAAKEEKSNEIPEDEKNDSDSRSPSPENSGKITYITSFGGEDELTIHSKISINFNKPSTLGGAIASSMRKNPITIAGEALTYADKVKQNLEKLKQMNENRSKSPQKPMAYQRRDYSRSRTKSRDRRRGNHRDRSRSSRRRPARSHSRSNSRHRYRSRNKRLSSSSSFSSDSSTYHKNRRHGERLKINEKSKKKRSESNSSSTSSSSKSDTSRSRSQSPKKKSVPRSGSIPIKTVPNETNSSASTISPKLASQTDVSSVSKILNAQIQLLPLLPPPPPPPSQIKEISVIKEEQKMPEETIPVRKYYGRKRDGQSSSEEIDYDEEEGGEEQKESTIFDSNTSSVKAKKISNPGKAASPHSKETTSSSATSVINTSKTAFNPRDRLKRKMQILLNKQYKADKLAEIEKNERQIQQQQERDDEMRELALKLRRRQRELRHKYGSPADSQSDNSEKSANNVEEVRKERSTDNGNKRSKRDDKHRSRSREISKRKRSLSRSNRRYREDSRDRNKGRYQNSHRNSSRSHYDDRRDNRRRRSRENISRRPRSNSRERNRNKQNQNYDSRRKLVDY